MVAHVPPLDPAAPPTLFPPAVPECSLGQEETAEKSACVSSANSDPSASPTTPSPGPASERPIIRHFDRYELTGEGNQGGMGVVYPAWDTMLLRTVALKMLRAGLFATADEVARFHREGRAIAQLDHPHIIKIYEVGQAEGQHYFTMPFLSGGSLAGVRTPEGADPDTVVALVVKVARAVQHAHEHGILHRDLKPGNVLLDDRGEPMVADFGLAKFLAADGELTQTGQRPGTLPYMAPEQVAENPGPTTAQTDVWALGVILYELLAGRRPFAGRSQAALTRAILSGEPPGLRTVRPQMDRTLEGIVLECLAKDPRQRYSSAAALADDLQRWSQGERLPVGRRPAGPGRRLRWPWAIVAAVLAAAITLPLAFRGPAEKSAPTRPALTLIGDSGGPREIVWWRGQDVTQTALQGPDGVFCVTSRGTAVLELCPTPPWPAYRFEARVRHDEDLGGTVGLCFACRQVPADASGRFASLTFDDRGAGRGVVQLNLEYGRVRPGEGERFASSRLAIENLRLAPPAAEAPRWRRLVVEVTADCIRASWDGNPVPEVPREKWLKKNAALGGEFPALAGAEFPPGGGLGLFLKKAKASFREVRVSPLPEEP